MSLLALGVGQRDPAGRFDGARRERSAHREDITQGLENAPQAFWGLFQGSNVGKLLVQVSE
ncbi:MAG: hypothetical protein ACKVZ0_23150 [Gemmatimonadales bacterium]